MVGCTKNDPCQDCAARMKGMAAANNIAEMQLHAASSFVTLTYADENLPDDLLLGYRQVQMWFKTMRNRQSDTLQFADGRKYTASLPKKFRYYVAAEFGPKRDRLHWHLLLFGMPCGFPHPAPGRKPWKALSMNWKHGFVTWEPATVGRCSYAASYSVKKQAEALSFSQGSRKPGLGTTFYKRLGAQAYHRGLLPQNIPCLDIGKSKWPLSKRAKQNIIDGWMSCAKIGGDFEAIRTFSVSKHDAWLNYKAKVSLYMEQENPYQKIA